jgi:hypothetical protein
MKPLIATILLLILGLVSNLPAFAKGTQEAPLSDSANGAGVCDDSDSPDQSDLPDGTPITLFRVEVFRKSAPVLKTKGTRLRLFVASPLQTRSHLASDQDLFRREAVLRI